jgi:predicted nuclease of predicted toxin-antitoxin system
LKVLLDTCVWGGVLVDFEHAGHDVVWAGDWEKDPGDEEILAIAHQEGRVLITLDKDFGELAIFRGLSHSGIVRLVNLSARQQGVYGLRVLEKYHSELAAEAMVTVERDRVRVRTISE